MNVIIHPINIASVLSYDHLVKRIDNKSAQAGSVTMGSIQYAKSEFRCIMP